MFKAKFNCLWHIRLWYMLKRLTILSLKFIDSIYIGWYKITTKFKKIKNWQLLYPCFHRPRIQCSSSKWLLQGPFCGCKSRYFSYLFLLLFCDTPRGAQGLLLPWALRTLLDFGIEPRWTLRPIPAVLLLLHLHHEYLKKNRG